MTLLEQIKRQVKQLPPEKQSEVLDFARFLEAQMLTEMLIQEEGDASIEDDNERWDALLATDESQMLLDTLTDEALAEHRAGKTMPLAFSDEGRLTPG